MKASTLFGIAVIIILLGSAAASLAGNSGGRPEASLSTLYHSRLNNTAPVITTVNVTWAFEDVLYLVDYDAVDNETAGDGLIWSLNSTAGFLTINASTGVLQGTPSSSDIGVYSVNVTVTDGNATNGTTSAIFGLEVLNSNDPPEITTAPLATILEDEHYSVQFNATDQDPDAGNITWGLVTDAVFLNINTTSGLLEGTPLNAHVGTFSVNVTATDGEADNSTGFFVFDLQVVNVNDPPIITSGNTTATLEDYLYRVDYSAYDPDPTGDVITWSLTTNAGFLSIDEATGVLQGTPNNDDVGTYWVNITAHDDKNASASFNFSLRVANANDPPVITGTPKTEVDEGEFYETDLNATDIDPTGDKLSWSMLTNCPFLSISKATGTINGTVDKEGVGTYWLNVSVSDGRGGSDWLNFTLTVHPVNDAPVGVDAHFEIKEDAGMQILNLSTIFSDEEGDPLSYSVLGNFFLNASITKNILDFKPKKDFNGWENLTIIATDGHNVAGATVHVRVLPVNDPPRDAGIALITLDMLTSTLDDTSVLSLRSWVTDPDLKREGDRLSYVWTSNITGLLGRTKDLSNLTLAPGRHFIKLVITDKAGESTEANIVLTIGDSGFTPGSDDDTSLDDDEPTEGDKISNLLILVAIIAGAMMLIALIFFISTRLKQDDEDDEEDADSVSEIDEDEESLEDEDDESLEDEDDEFMEVDEDDEE